MEENCGLLTHNITEPRTPTNTRDPQMRTHSHEDINFIGALFQDLQKERCQRSDPILEKV